MQATATLATTTFLAPVGASDTQINLTSTSGIVPGVFLFANREAFRVVGLTGVGNYVSVLRGRDGTATQPHGTAETIYIARGDQLYQSDPTGLPPAAVLVSPYINIATGVLWTVQGDDVGPQTGARSWQPITTTQSIGPLGVRTNATTTPS